MEEKILIDTSAFVALAYADDQFHDRILKYWQKESEKGKFVVTNLVVLETASWLRYKLGKKIAVDFVKVILNNPKIEKIRVELNDELKAWKLFEKQNGRGLSMIDCASMVIMEKLKIKKTLSFDTDFQKQGFKLIP